MNMDERWRITYPGDSGPDPTNDENNMVVFDAVPKRPAFAFWKWFNAAKQSSPFGSFATVETNQSVERISASISVSVQDAHMLVHNSGKQGRCGHLYGLLLIGEDLGGYFQFVYFQNKNGYVQQRGIIGLCSPENASPMIDLMSTWAKAQAALLEK